MSDWRYPSERKELVERLIRAEGKVALLNRTLQEYAEHVDDDPSAGSYAVALQARIAQLEANVEKLTQRRKAS